MPCTSLTTCQCPECLACGLWKCAQCLTFFRLGPGAEEQPCPQCGPFWSLRVVREPVPAVAWAVPWEE